MTIATVDDIVSGLSAAQIIRFSKVGAAPKAVGAWQSHWMAAGWPGAGAASPAYTAGSGYNCDKSTNGAMRYVNGSVQNWLAELYLSASVASTFLLVDRLWSCSGMGFAAGTYAVTTPGTLPARITDSGVAVWAAVEQFAVAGSASGTLTLNYLNTLGQAKAGVIAAVLSAPGVGVIQPIPLQVGDIGISQVTNAINSATWTSGSFGITLFKTIAEISVDFAGGGRNLDWSMLGLPKIPADACLQLIQIATATTATNVMGTGSVIDK